jgi:hypothetical protein
MATVACIQPTVICRIWIESFHTRWFNPSDWQCVVDFHQEDLVQAVFIAMMVRQYLINQGTPLPTLSTLPPEIEAMMRDPTIKNHGHVLGFVRSVQAMKELGFPFFMEDNAHLYLSVGGLLEGSGMFYRRSEQKTSRVIRRMNIIRSLCSTIPLHETGQLFSTTEDDIDIASTRSNTIDIVPSDNTRPDPDTSQPLASSLLLPLSGLMEAIDAARPSPPIPIIIPTHSSNQVKVSETTIMLNELKERFERCTRHINSDSKDIHHVLCRNALEVIQLGLKQLETSINLSNESL